MKPITLSRSLSPYLFTLALPLILSMGCASATSPDGEDSPAGSDCRYIPSTATFTFMAQSTVRTATIRCSYDRGRNVLSCSPTTPTSQCSAIYSATYRNIDDFIEEGHVVGKLNATAQTGLGLGDVCSDGASDATLYTYDAQHRLTAAESPLTSSRVTYSNWDAQGRPRTSVQTSGSLANCPITSDLLYDDSARTARVAGQTATNCPLPATVTGTLTLGPDFVDRTFNTTTTLLLAVNLPLQVNTILTGSAEQVCR